MSHLINNLLDIAFSEDVGEGDHTTLCSIPDNAVGKASLVIKEAGIVAGIDMAIKVFHKLDSQLEIEVLIKEGVPVKPGDIVFTVEGKVQSILQAERIMLNIMQRMSGVATATNKYVALIEGTGAKVLDTRKTTPGMRMIEKHAVKLGGGENHRIGLFDMILLKDNHIDFAGGIENAIIGANSYLEEKNKSLKIEIEVRDMDELNEVLRVGGVDRVMLDNFTPEETKKAVKLVNGRIEVESSGGITSETIRSYAEAGVDYISVGALTHSVKGLDMSLIATTI